ncbi:MAG: CapA family protein [Ruminococcaceae bacterium]|nr:CapA family protein [Oscillospiraceae bacterium]
MKTLLVGDICPTVYSTPYYKEKNIPALFGDTVTLFENKDLVFANIECAITESENKIMKFGPNLKAPLETAEMLKELGVTVCGLSNNHIFDFGKEGAIDSINAIKAAGLDYTGFGENYEDSRRDYVFEKDGEKVCIIAVCEHEYSYALEDRMGSRPYDEYDTMEDIRAAKAKYDRVLVMYHGGKEHCRYPSPRLRKLCRAMAKNGADVVLCQHTHCIGAYEEYEGCHILYGQGNFQFAKLMDMESWDTLLAVEYDTKSGEIAFTPIRSGEYGISLAKGEDKETIMSEFAKRNEQLHNGEWRQGWHEFCEANGKYYVAAIANACTRESTDRQNHNFAHYLDCEAHTDVWRELFPTWNLTNEK